MSEEELKLMVMLEEQKRRQKEDAPLSDEAAKKVSEKVKEIYQKFSKENDLTISNPYNKIHFEKNITK